DEICCDFAKLLSDFMLSKNPTLIESLNFLKKKIDNIYELNPSKQILFTKNIIHIQFLLFCDEHPEEDIAVLLASCETILNENNNEPQKNSWRTFVDFLHFEYYLSTKKIKQAELYYNKLIPSFQALMLHNYMGCVNSFFESAFYFCRANNFSDKLQIDVSAVLLDQADINSAINYNYYTALIAFHAGDTKKGRTILLKTVNDYSMVNFLRAEIEIKLTLCYFLLLEKEFDMADDYLRKIIRKVKSLPSNQFSHIEYIGKFFDLSINKEPNTKTDLKKKEMFTLFMASNNGHKQVLRPLIPILIEKHGLA
ncbi:MAG TPA: hypothetical protein VD905_20310, partial [Flavobacteriales bacterium]|nr:hypothetical protein [Flavobacteriales bacterium]